MNRYTIKHMTAPQIHPLPAAALAMVLVCATPIPTSAQDAHYWTNQYGTRGELVGGLVVGSFLDLSATYYNPGAMAFIDQPSLILTTDAWEYQTFDFDDLAPAGLDLRTGRLRPAPSIFAIQLPRKTSKHRFAISAVTRHSFEADAQATRIPTAEELADSNAPIATSLEANSNSRLSEGWIGFSWAHPLGQRLGIGVTTYVAGRGQFGRKQLFSQAVDSTGGGFSSRDIQEFSYWNIRLLWKAGVALDLRPLTLGLAITTPGVSLFGNGRVLTNDGITGIDLSDSTAVNELAANLQDKITSTYKSPPSVAIGASYRLGKTTAYATAEWFGGINEYTILDTDEFVSQTSGDTLSNDLIYEIKDVLNFGFGLEHAFSQRFQAYGAFFSDRSALPDGKDQFIPVAMADWDIWHATAGGAFVLGNIDITLGVSYGWGSDTIRKPITIPGESDFADLRYRSIKFIFGFAAAL